MSVSQLAPISGFKGCSIAHQVVALIRSIFFSLQHLLLRLFVLAIGRRRFKNDHIGKYAGANSQRGEKFLLQGQRFIVIAEQGKQRAVIATILVSSAQMEDRATYTVPGGLALPKDLTFTAFLLSRGVTFGFLLSIGTVTMPRFFASAI